MELLTRKSNWLGAWNFQPYLATSGKLEGKWIADESFLKIIAPRLLSILFIYLFIFLNFLATPCGM